MKTTLNFNLNSFFIEEKELISISNAQNLSQPKLVFEEKELI